MPASINFPGVNHEDGIILTHVTCRCGQSLRGHSINASCPTCQRPANEAILRTLVKLDDRGHVDDDLACETCQYNLRTQHYQNQCPECGSEIVKSIINSNIFLSHPKWVKNIRRGMTYFLVASCLIIAFRFLLSPWFPFARFIRMSPNILMMIGLILISKSNPRIDQFPKHWFTTYGLKIFSTMMCLSSLLMHLHVIIQQKIDIPLHLYARYFSIAFLSFLWLALLSYRMRLGQLIHWVKPGFFRRTCIVMQILIFLWLPTYVLLFSVLWLPVTGTSTFHSIVTKLPTYIVYPTYALLAFLTFATRRLYGRGIKEQTTLTS